MASFGSLDIKVIITSLNVSGHISTVLYITTPQHRLFGKQRTMDKVFKNLVLSHHTGDILTVKRIIFVEKSVSTNVINQMFLRNSKTKNYHL